VVARTTFAYLKKARKDEAVAVDGPDLQSVPHPGDPPDRYAERRTAVELLDRLPAEQRHALVLHHVLGMSVPEIARELEVPDETVRSRLRLGRNRLRDAGGDAA
jgi:RNA polymerase sigma-70 factor (ECF subfamily)